MLLKNTSMVWRSYEFWWKLNNDAAFWPSADACKFLRNYVFGVLWKATFLLLLGFFALGGLFDLGIIAFNPHSFQYIFPDKLYGRGDALFFAGYATGGLVSLAAGLATIFASCYGVTWLLDTYITGIGPKISETMVGQYVKGVAHKFCPSLSFVDAAGEPLEHPNIKRWRGN